MKKFAIVGLCLALLFAFSFDINAESFPEDDIRVIVPWAPGGGTDLLARSLASAAERYTDVNIVVENVEGGMAAVALDRVHRADPDGYEVLVASENVGWQQEIDPDFPVTFDDLTMVMALNADPAGFTVSADAEWETIEELAEYAEENPGLITVGHSGEGMVWHIAGARLADYFDVEFNYIPYDGAAPAISAMLGGHIDAVSVGAAEVADQVIAEDARILGVMGDERITPLPDEPTFKEQGYDLEVYTIRGLVAPPDVPEDRVDKLYEIFSQALQDEEFQESMQDLGMEILDAGPEEYKQMMEEEAEINLEILRELGMID